MRSVIILISLIIFSSVASADVVLTMETSEGGGAPLEGKMYISGNKMKMNEGGEQEVIFRGDKESLITIMRDEKKYMVITKDDMARMGNKVNDAMNRMQAQMANLPPEQQAMMKQMMGGAMAKIGGGQGEKKPPAEIKNTGKKETVGEFNCVVYEVTRGGEKTREYCVTKPSAISGGEEARQAFQSMGKFFEALIQTMSDGPFASAFENPFSEFSSINGIPIRTVQYKNGQVERKTTIKGVTKETLALSTFDPPADYARQKGIEGL